VCGAGPGGVGNQAGGLPSALQLTTQLTAAGQPRHAGTSGRDARSTHATAAPPPPQKHNNAHLCAADEAHRRQPEAVRVQRLVRGRHHVGVVAQTQVVVGAEVEHRLLALQHTCAWRVAVQPGVSGRAADGPPSAHRARCRAHVTEGTRTANPRPLPGHDLPQLPQQQ
jgi:hypothetical protein